MQNMPNISPMEVVVVGAAVLLYSAAPALLSWNERRRRRRMSAELARAALGSDAAILGAAGAVDSPAESSGPEIGSAEPLPEDTVGQMLDEPADTMAASPTPLSSTDTLETSPATEAPRYELRGEEAPSPEPEHYRIQLQDLRRVRLRDWPSAMVRNDPERNRAWQEGQRAAEEYQSLIGSTVLSSPCAAQSACLGFAEEHGSTLQLRFLLFPILWPVSDEQAVAEAVFEVDRVSGELHSQVRARR